MSDTALNASVVRTCGAALAAARQRIGAVDARVLLQSAAERTAADLIAHPDHVLTAEQDARFEQWVRRRARGEPVAYITGEREFFGRVFRVTPDVLVPRPETELLVELALARLPVDAASIVLDLGTGSGCVAVTLAAERSSAQVVAVDVSRAALAVARANAACHGVTNVCFCVSDWFAAVGATARFDVIVANPPYVGDADRHLAEGDLRFEPRRALTPGADDLAALRHIIGTSPRHLAAGGSLYVEHGYDQGPACRSLLLANGFRDVASYRDVSGHERASGGLRAAAG